MANVLTGARIICGLLILAFPAFSKPFYLFYLLGGLTDAVDGTVARALGKESGFGAKFDTAADIVFALAVFAKLAGSLHFPLWLVIWIGIIALIRAANVVAGFLKHRRLPAVHSAMNKVCGLAAFLTVLLLGGGFAWQARAAAVLVSCILASIAAVQESGLILSEKG